MRHYRRRRRADDVITAAELACFAYCPEQWRLEYGLGLPPANRAALDAGTRHHERKVVAERVAGGSIGYGRVLIAVALVLLRLGESLPVNPRPGQCRPCGMREHCGQARL
jgi:hypothetical protein